MIEAMGVLMGIQLDAFTREEGSTENPAAGPSSPPPPSSSSGSKPKAPEPEDVKMADAEDPEEEDPEAIAEKKAQAEAEEQKKLGSDAYRKRDFATAQAAFQKAWEIWPKDVTFLTNLAGAVLPDIAYSCNGLMFFSDLL